MLMIEINPDWNYKQMLSHLKTLRHDFEDALASFSSFELHEKVLFVYEIKNAIYSLNFEYWKKDRIWEYLNHDLSFAILQNFK